VKLKKLKTVSSILEDKNSSLQIKLWPLFDSVTLSVWICRKRSRRCMTRISSKPYLTNWLIIVMPQYLVISIHSPLHKTS
jgi:hypothetical protein